MRIQFDIFFFFKPVSFFFLSFFVDSKINFFIFSPALCGGLAYAVTCWYIFSRGSYTIAMMTTMVLLLLSSSSSSKISFRARKTRDRFDRCGATRSGVRNDARSRPSPAPYTPLPRAAATSVRYACFHYCRDNGPRDTEMRCAVHCRRRSPLLMRSNRSTSDFAKTSYISAAPGPTSGDAAQKKKKRENDDDDNNNKYVHKMTIIIKNYEYI